MSHLYLVPLVIAIIIGFVHLITIEISRKKMIDKPFLNELSNELYVLSYSIPFSWFINPNENDKRVKDLNKIIIDANENHRLNYRVYVTIQILIFLASIVLFFLFSLIANNSASIIKFLFNIQMDLTSPDSILKMKIIIGMVLMSFILIPSMYLKRKAKNNKFFFLKDLPILQLFIILMLKAKRPLGEVIYVLSTTNTRYKYIFATAYRMYVSDKNSAMEYLYNAFEDTKFADTVLVLKEYGDYSKAESLTVLNNNLKDITEFTNTLKRRKDIGTNVFSQLSLAVPFLSVILLAFSPLVYYGINLLNV